jgi:hypothetical protein
MILAAIGLLAVVYVMIPLGLAARGQFRRHRLVRCPIVGLAAGVRITRAGWAEALGCRSLRRVSDCTFWPHHQGCAQRCRELPDEEICEFPGRWSGSWPSSSG